MMMLRTAVVGLVCILSTIAAQDIIVPPTLVKQPVKEYYFKEDDAKDVHDLECLAEGTPEPFYEWKKNGEPFVVSGSWSYKGGNTGGTITIAAPQASDAGYYQCFAKNANGMVAVSTLSYYRRAKLSPFPRNQPVVPKNVVEGDDVTLVCDGWQERSVPKAIISWELYNPVTSQSTPLPKDPRLQIDDDGSLRMAYVVPQDSKGDQQYRCSVYNNPMGLSAYTSPYQVTVTPDNSRPSIAPKLMFRTRPDPTTNTVVFLRGGNLTLSCIMAGRDTPVIHWYKLDDTGRERGTQGTVDRMYKLFIRSVSFDDEGTYRCKGVIDDNSLAEDIAVTIEAAPYWIEENGVSMQPKDTNVTAGDDFVFHCGATGVPVPDNPVFYSNGRPLDFNNPRILYDDTEPMKFTLKNVSKADLQVFQCNVSNKHDSLFASAYLNIIAKTELLVEPKQDIIYEEEDKPSSVRFNCSARGDPSTPLTYTWFYKNTDNNKFMQLQAGGPYSFVTDGEDKMDLEVSLEKGKVHVEYECRVDNGYKPVVVAASLRNKTPAVIVQSGAAFPWWIIAVILAIIVIIIAIIIIICLIQRNKGETYPVDEKERAAGRDPEKELAANDFSDFTRQDQEPIEGSRVSLTDVDRDSIKPLDSDNDSMAEYGDIDTGKFNEDGSFIGQYGTGRKNKPTGYQNPGMSEV